MNVWHGEPWHRMGQKSTPIWWTALPGQPAHEQCQQTRRTQNGADLLL
jgi:hypothetical protein